MNPASSPWTTAAALTLLLAVGASAQDILFTSDDFQSWEHPRGLVNVTAAGVSVKRFGTTFNAVANAAEFKSSVIGDYGVQPVRSPSGARTARFVVDQDPDTWWQPSPDDDVQKWWVEIDLGRAVVADSVRLIFPDTVGARPFTFFSVFVSPGIPVFGGREKRIVFTRVGRPVNNNTQRVVAFDLKTTNLQEATGENLTGGSVLDFDLVRFVRFEAAGKTPDAALAEIEVDGVAFNLSTRVRTALREKKGLADWGGRTWTSKDRDCDGCGKGAGADELIDQDLGFRGWNIEASDKGDWRDSGTWSVVDFGSVFRVNRVLWVPIVGGRGPFLYGFQRDKQGGWGAFQFLVSDGTPSNQADPVVEGPFAYDLLSSVENKGRYLFDFRFEPRPIRLVLWRVLRAPQFSRAVQLFVFQAEGYPNQVQLESDDISLGGARSIRRVEWDADVPPGTRLEVDTQTGNGFTSVTRYFLVNGKEVSKEAYNSARKRNRGKVVQEQVRDATWSAWSRPHRFSGQAFQSPSPRQWLRARVRLISEDPEVMPVLRSLRFVASSPIVTDGVTGQVLPREAFVDSLQEFRYTIKPKGFRSRDAGFDRVVIGLPAGSADAEFVRATVRGAQVEAQAVVRHDSLIVDLPPPAVRRDSVEVVFRARVFESPTVFPVEVANSDQEGNAQGVVPVELGADQVFVPAAVAAGPLLRGIEHNRTFTPNGDGVNDLFELTFTVVKTVRDPVVRVYTLGSRRVAELADLAPGSPRARFTWDGTSADGALVPPGVYIVDVEVDADARNDRVQRLVHVVY